MGADLLAVLLVLATPLGIFVRQAAGYVLTDDWTKVLSSAMSSKRCSTMTAGARHSLPQVLLRSGRP